MNLVLLEATELGDGATVQVTGDRARHLTRVLEVTPGRTIRVGVLGGRKGTAVVRSAGEGAVVLQCTFDADDEPRPAVDLLLALPRPKVLRRLWAQLAALGVGRIILTNAARVERNYFDTHVLTPACYRPLLVEGLQQASDTHLPVVSIHRQLKILIEDDLDGLFPDGLRLVADPGPTASLGATVRHHPSARILLAIGPEGGWNAFELDLLESRGFRPAGFGPRTLRSDTACIALLALVHEAMRTSGEPESQ